MPPYLNSGDESTARGGEGQGDCEILCDLAHSPQIRQRCRSRADAVDETLQGQVLIGGVVGLVCVAVRDHKSRQFQDFGEHIIRQTTTSAGDLEGLDPLSSPNGIFQGCCIGRI